MLSSPTLRTHGICPDVRSLRRSTKANGNQACVLTSDAVQQLLKDAIEALNVEGARREVEPFLHNPVVLQVWSKEFFRDVAGRIVFV